MRKFFTILLLAFLICIPVFGCGIALDSQELSSSAIEVDEAPTPSISNTPVLKTIAPTFDPAMQIPIEDAPEDEPMKETAGVMYFTEDDVIKMAKVLYRECRGIPSDTEKACVVWVVCNRVDSDEFPGDTIEEIVTAPNQFAYYYNTPASDYTYFTGDGVHNYFRNAYKGNCSIWDYSLPSPYES